MVSIIVIISVGLGLPIFALLGEAMMTIIRRRSRSGRGHNIGWTLAALALQLISDLQLTSGRATGQAHYYDYGHAASTSPTQLWLSTCAAPLVSTTSYTASLIE
eukprot:gene41482-51379_t